MRVFVCLLDPDGRGIPERVLRSFEAFPRGRGLMFTWQRFAHAAVLTAWDDHFGDPMVACERNHLAVGVARLDNRYEVKRLAGTVEEDLTDLQVVLHATARQGPACVKGFLGDFAFVVCNATTSMAVAACDALAVKKLYYAKCDGLLAFSGHAEALALTERYDLQFLAERVGGCAAAPELTVYDGVQAIPGGTLVLLDSGTLTVHQYWSPEEISGKPGSAIPAPEASEALRDLLTQAVRSRLSGDRTTWAQLSGGLDSSSVVSVVQSLVEAGTIDHGLAGTVTYVDRQATAADERDYSDIVVRRWQLPNQAIVDPPMWYDERQPVPRLDQPRQNLMFYPREYHLCDIVRRSGGRVLLTGQGPDEYLRGTMFFFADWIARGRALPAVREMARRAAIGRVSFWELAYRNAVTPLLPGPLQRWLGPEVTRLPPWVQPAIARRYDLHKRSYELTLYGGRLGEKYRGSMVGGVLALQRTIGHLVLDDALDVRHPFLDRRLVEFGLRLPHTLTAQPHAGKWVLREAMRGLLPEPVRTRVGKGTQNERHAWALVTQRALLEPLVREPILADLGLIDGRKLQAAFDAAPHQPQRKGDPHAVLQQVLAIEAWLQIRAGRWPRGTTTSGRYVY